MTFLWLKRSPLNWSLRGVRRRHGPMQGQNVLVLGWALRAWPWPAGACAAAPGHGGRYARSAPQLALLQQELPQVRFVAGPFDASLVDGKGLHAVYRSPGLSPATFAPVFQAAQAIGLVTGSELTLYAAALACCAASTATHRACWPSPEPMAKPRSHRSPGNWWSVLAKPWRWRWQHWPHTARHPGRSYRRGHIAPGLGAGACPAFSSMASLALNPRPPRC